MSSTEALATLTRLVQEYKAAMDEIGGYLEDLTIESQNNLLHGLFEAKVPPRKPLDPKHKVISMAEAEELIRYFQSETAWEKNMASINASVVEAKGTSGDGFRPGHTEK